MTEHKPHPLRIQRKRTKGYRLPEGAVCVTRPGKWGNPFTVVSEKTCRRIYRTVCGGMVDMILPMDAVTSYREWMLETDEGSCMVAMAKAELRGKQLACFCPLDKPCHADVLAEIANEESK